MTHRSYSRIIFLAMLRGTMWVSKTNERKCEVVAIFSSSLPSQSRSKATTNRLPVENCRQTDLLLPCLDLWASIFDQIGTAQFFSHWQVPAQMGLTALFSDVSTSGAGSQLGIYGTILKFTVVSFSWPQQEERCFFMIYDGKWYE